MTTAKHSKFKGSEWFWADSVMSLFIPTVGYFGKALTQRLLPPFNNLAEEAYKFQDEEYKRLCAISAFHESDYSAIAERAHDNSVSWYTSMVALKQSVINLHAVGLRHLFEQQLFNLVHYVPLASRKQANYEKDLRAMCANGVNVEHFDAWPAL